MRPQAPAGRVKLEGPICAAVESQRSENYRSNIEQQRDPRCSSAHRCSRGTQAALSLSVFCSMSSSCSLRALLAPKVDDGS